VSKQTGRFDDLPANTYFGFAVSEEQQHLVRVHLLSIAAVDVLNEAIDKAFDIHPSNYFFANAN
jgi:hypothetical protein